MRASYKHVASCCVRAELPFGVGGFYDINDQWLGEEVGAKKKWLHYDDCSPSPNGEANIDRGGFGVMLRAQRLLAAEIPLWNRGDFQQSKLRLRLFLVLGLFLGLLSPSFAQTPAAFNYQAVLRQPDGNPMNSTTVELRFSITNDLTAEEIVYTENHLVITSPLGVVNLKIGRGETNFGPFSAIDWSTPKFLTMGLRESANDEFLTFSTAELLAVPYALYADRVNDQSNLTRIGDTLLYANTNGELDTVFLGTEATVPDVRDDYLIYRSADFTHDLLRNDRAVNDLRITELDGQPISSNSSISLREANFINLRLEDSGQSVTITSDRLIDTLLQFTYAVGTATDEESLGLVTLRLNNTDETAGIALSRQEFQTLINTATAGDTLDGGGQKVLVGGSPVTVIQPVTIKNFCFQRAASSTTFLAEASTSSSQEIIVENTQGFMVGDWILIVNGPEHNNNSGGQILAIQEVAGDTIRTFQSFTFPMPAGARVIHQFPLVRIQASAGNDIRFENVIFDGNKEENSFTYDWKYNSTINVRAGVSLDNCTFKNMPTENIFICGGEVANCRSYDLNGSFVHVSCASGVSAESLVEGNFSYNTCLISKAENGHNEGWFTYSANVRNCLVRNNVAVFGGEACFGAQGLDDFGNTFTGNTFDTFLRRKFATSSAHPMIDVLTDNTFINVPE